MVLTKIAHSCQIVRQMRVALHVPGKRLDKILEPLLDAGPDRR